MYIVTAAEMRRLDAEAIGTLGIPSVVLMENAGKALADTVASYAARHGIDTSKRIVILAGKGNNGGDGLVAARHLNELGWQIEVWYAESPDRMVGDAALQRTIICRLGIAERIFSEGSEPDWSGACCIVDALLGTGTGGAPREPYAALIRAANASGLPIVAADIPSGLDADTGQVYDPCIRAAATVSFAFLKRGLVQFPGAGYAGESQAVPIGIPAVLAQQGDINVRYLNEDMLRQCLGVDPHLSRQEDTHKGTYGHVLIAAGSRAMSGAGLLSATAALRAGAGLVTWAVPGSLAGPLTGVRPELMLMPLDDSDSGDWSHVEPEALASLAADRNALVIGPGLGAAPGGDGASWLERLWRELPEELPVLLDADALNWFAAGDSVTWPERSGPIVITPHPGEMGRLAGTGTSQVQQDRIKSAGDYARQHGITVVLKGARTVIACPDGRIYINSTGNPGMATGGMGDVLSGMIGTYLAAGKDAASAAALGVYLHGVAGDRAAARRRSAASLLPSDLLEEL
ncbi:bifunctional ADP-dependent NAD(P)H-hydrate dehydratase/NAD(P)H-hydrate epimerase [Paenibacillus sambharensis]|uniref:Bifunctional NAD(P)H-hydrate repair enzyme n=1 Tax=Paenibacillus sambharensis TaxID=1803190 RepID=A0A2W1LIA9_9BACL|nr:NAD(P)H-hydrate dehydratase [Paenibacillus sambharensis]PZD94685.1 bifunctional ADP-dependent NAD(P)H-hydrate dehydratase/NAD(P)H-hydrate epimerase [Paenibacillus sambharensis]